MTIPQSPAAHDVLHVELCMSTHLAIVVNARVDFEQTEEYVGLVIPRSHCHGDRPSQHALKSAATDMLARWVSSGPLKRPAPRAVWARINGHWTSLLAPASPSWCLA